MLQVHMFIYTIAVLTAIEFIALMVRYTNLVSNMKLGFDQLSYNKKRHKNTCRTNWKGIDPVT